MITKSTFHLLLAIASVSLCALSACDANTVVDQNTVIENRTWSYEKVPQYKVHITDLSKTYNVYINFRHTTEYAYSNLFLLITQTNPNKSSTRYRKEIKLAELDGRWTGKSAGSLYAHQVLLHKNYTFPDTGIYTFTIAQNMRENPLKEIVDIGLKVNTNP